MISAESILEECELPPMPHVASQVMSLATDPKSSVEDMQKVIFADQALTSRLLMIANSAFYGATRQIDTLSDAIMRLGIEAVKNISIALSTRDVFQTHSIIEQRLWEHAIGVSVCSSLIGGKQKEYKIKGEECIVAGLLHDIGHAVLKQSQKEKFVAVMETVCREKKSYPIVEQDVFGFTHQDVGALLFREWKMSDELIKVAQYHHQCNEAPNLEEAEGLCKIVGFADCICERLGVGFPEPMEELCPNDSSRIKALGLSDDDIKEIIQVFQEKFIEEKKAFMD